MSSVTTSTVTSVPLRVDPSARDRGLRGPSMLATSVCLALLAFVFRGRIADLLHNTHSIQLFVLAVSFGLLVWRTRRARFAESVRESAQGGVLLAISLAGLVALDAWRRPIVSSTPLLMASAAFGIVWTLYGWAEARRQIFPVAYLLLMTPIPVVLMVAIDLPLQILSASLGCTVARVLGIGVERFGTNIRLQHADVSLRIIGDCNGLRSAIAMLAVAVLLGWLLHAPLKKRLTLVVTGLALAYAGNIARITTLLAMLSHFGQRFVPYFSRFEEWFGALVFAACIVALYITSKGLGWGRFREI